MTLGWLSRRTWRRLRHGRGMFVALVLAFAVVAALGAGAHSLARQSRQAASRLAEQAHVIAYLAPEVTGDRAASLRMALGRLPGVQQVRALDGAAALAQLQRELAALGQDSQALSAVEADFLPASIEIVLEPGPDLPARATDAAARLRRQPGIAAVDAMAEGLGRAAAFVALTDRLAHIVGGVAVLAGCALVAGLVVIERRRRRREAETLTLLGATALALRLPAGLLAALAALLGGACGLPLGGRAAGHLLGTPMLWQQVTGAELGVAFAALALAGLLIGWLSVPRVASAAVLLLLMAGHAPAQTIDAAAPAPLADAVARARTREAIIAERSQSTEARARAQALAAYRLARKRAALFLADPPSRAQNARALDAALWVLARESSEAALWREDLRHAAHDRAALENSEAASDPAATDPQMALQMPARGALVGVPGIRRDEATSALLRQEGVRILSRLNEPARAPAGGQVYKVAALPQGGFALVITHEGGAVGILAGLRQVEVAEGDRVEAGQRIGLVGRDLDGAPVMTFELWQRGTSIDPRAFLHPSARD